METPFDPEIVLQNTKSLRQLALTLVRDEHLADDLVQETWLAAIRRPPEQPGALRAWLGRVLRNLAVSERRRSGARERREVRRASPEEGQERHDQTFERFEVLKRVVDLVAKLNEPGRSTVILHFFEGLTLRQVADRQNVSHAAVRFRLKGALDRLRARLDRCFSGRSAWTVALASLLAPGALSTAQAGVACAGAPSVPIQEFLGGILSMSAKKVTLSIAAAVAVLLGIAGLWQTVWRSDVPQSRVATRAEPGGPDRDARAGRGRPGDKVEPGPVDAETQRAQKLDPLSIHGRVVSAGSGVASARLIAIPLARWNLLAAGGSEESDAHKRLSSLNEEYLREASAAPQTRSAADGSFAFRGLAEGGYRLLVSHPDHLPNVEKMATVADGATARVEIELAPAARIAGLVVDEARRPVANARIDCETAESAALKGVARDLKRFVDWESGWPVVEMTSVQSGADGSFRLVSLAPELHAIRASREGYLDGEVSIVPPGERVVLTLKQGSAVTGRVVDREERPIAGAAVSLASTRLTEVHRIFDSTGSEQEEPPARALEARTGEDGRFKIAGVPAYSHDLSVTAKGFAPLSRQLDAAAGNVELGDIALSDPLQIGGRVSGPDGRPLSGARVWAGELKGMVQAANVIVPEPPPLLSEARSDGNGRFVLTGLPAGSFHVRAEAEGFADTVAADVSAGKGDLELVLSAGITVHGRVIDAAGGTPIQGAEVRIGLRHFKKSVSESDGKFTVRGVSPEEVYYGKSALRVTHPEYGMHSADETMVLGRTEATPLEIRLARAAYDIEGQVRDFHGSPVASAQVWLESMGEEGGYTSPEDRTLSGPDGGFRIREPSWLRHNVSRLKLGVVVSHPAYAAARVGPLDLPETGQPWHPLEVVLTEGAVLEGKIADKEGLPLSGARVTVSRAETGKRSALGLDAFVSARKAHSAKDGGYRIRGLEPGPVVVLVTALDHAPETIQGLVLGVEPTRQDFTLGRGGSITGRVADTEGNPLAGIEVTALVHGEAPMAIESEFLERMERRSRSGIALVRTGDDGRYELAHLPEAVYTVVARASGFEASRAEGVPPGGTAPEIVLARFSAVRGMVVAAQGGAIISTFTVNVIDLARRRSHGGDADWRIGSQGELRFGDRLGRFFYDGLRPGEYEVIVSASGFLASHRDVKLAPGVELPIETRLERGARIEGVVLDAETGTPISDVRLNCSRQMPRVEREAAMKKRSFPRPPFPLPSGLGNAASGGDGAYVIDGLLDGEYSVSTLHPFFAAPGAMVEVGAGETARLEVRMKPTGRIEGFISGLRPSTAAEGRMHYTLRFDRLDPRAEGQEKSGDEWGVAVDHAGRFQAQGLHPGAYRLSLTMQEFRLGKFTEIGPGEGRPELAPVGPARSVSLGEVAIRPRETILFHGEVK